MKTGPKPIPPEIRFWRFVEKRDECWLWTGNTMHSGYGNFGIGVKNSDGAHRFSWRMHRGEIPKGMFVCHKCNVKLCVNPDHLYLGTPAKNSRDAQEDGLLEHKLSVEKVLEIRRLSADGFSLSALAARFGVTDSMIGHIRAGRSWTHV